VVVSVKGHYAEEEELRGESRPQWQKEGGYITYMTVTDIP
jgi:hypothetical protein